MVETYKPIYTVSQAAEVLQVNKNAVYDLMNRGMLPYLVLGAKKIRGSDLERFIEQYPTEKVEKPKSENKSEICGKQTA